MTAFSRFRIIGAFVLMAALVTCIASTQALSNGHIEFGWQHYHYTDTCQEFDVDISATMHGTTVDETNPDIDLYDVMLLDGDGTIIDNYIYGTGLGSDYVTNFTMGDWNGVHADSMPLTVRLIDIGNPGMVLEDSPEAIAAALAAPVLDEATLDLRDVWPVECGNLPTGSMSAGSACLALPSGAVVGQLPNATQAYFSPGNLSTVTVNAGTYWVIGVDSSGAYYKIVLACQYLWVPINTMQPSYQAPWHGESLPTGVVS